MFINIYQTEFSQILICCPLTLFSVRDNCQS